MRQLTRLLVLIPAISIALASPILAQKVTVDSADPSSTVQGTTLNVTIRGKGFAPGSISKFLVTGTSGNGRVTVNSTAYINSTTLVANITAADDAVISLYDIAVTSNGRTGKGIEKFSVQKKQQDEEINPIVLGVPEGCDDTASITQLFRMNDGIDLPSLRFPANFDNCPQGIRIPYLWVGTRWELLDLLPGMTGGFAMDVSANGAVVGYNWCHDSNGDRCLPIEAFIKQPGQPSQILPATGFPSEFRDAKDITSDGLHVIGSGTEGALLWTWDAQSSQWVSDVVGAGAAYGISRDGNTVIGVTVDKPGDWNRALAWVRSNAGEPFEQVDLGYPRVVADVAPSGQIAVGLRWLQECGNRRCSYMKAKEVPVYWLRDANGDWSLIDLSARSPSGSEYSYGCSAWGVSEVVGKGPVIVGRCQGAIAVAWIPGADGQYGALTVLPAGDVSSSATAWAVNKYGWVLGQQTVVGGRRLAVLWKLP